MTTFEDADAAVSAGSEMADSAPAKSFTTGKIGLVAVGIALLSAAITFAVLADITPFQLPKGTAYILQIANGVIVLALLLIIARDAWQMVQARRRGRAGSRLHVEIVRLFSVIAVVPAILVAVVATFTLDGMLDRFFNQRNRAILQNSFNISQLYLNQHTQTLTGDVKALQFDVVWLKPYFEQDRAAFKQELSARAASRRLSAAVLVDKTGTIMEKAELGGQQVRLPPPATLAEITESEPTFLVSQALDTVGAAIKLNLYNDAYLVVSRQLDPMVAAHLRESQVGLLAFTALEENRLTTQLVFISMLAEIALAVLLSALWLGFNFANRLVAPIRRLIAAANLVSKGNLLVQVPIGKREGDVGQLGHTFNTMTQDLRTQHSDLVRARDLIDSRRLFTEAVLAGASAGVIGVDANGHVSILNRSAEKLIGCSEGDALGRAVLELAPELASLVASASVGPQRLTQGQVSITRAGRERTVSVRVTTEQSADPTHGYVITLDDITELVAAQRTSAWADIARRIAHEIKNPLTPIQLSAERLRRKYGPVITEDKAVFEQCTNTIVRQVDDIRRMVDEFSRFARMPKPVIAAEDVADTVRQVVFLMRVGNADIDFDVEIAEGPMPAAFDRRLISQGLTNIIKNATEAIAAVPPAELGRGKIHVTVQRVGSAIMIDVVDNGIGLPRENRNRLLEPYVTTREKGTGLGLAIVGKILEEHGGTIELRDASEKVPDARGTWVRLTFVSQDAAKETGPEPAMREVAS
jgi:two-component system nitrogen regulation sensor histidine kinase NtrY